MPLRPQTIPFGKSRTPAINQRYDNEPSSLFDSFVYSEDVQIMKNIYDFSAKHDFTRGLWEDKIRNPVALDRLLQVKFVRYLVSNVDKERYWFLTEKGKTLFEQYYTTKMRQRRNEQEKEKKKREWGHPEYSFFP